MTSYPSDYHREYLPYSSYFLFQFEGSDVISVHKTSIEYLPCSSYFLFQFEGSDVISVLKNSIECSFALFKCLLKVTNSSVMHQFFP